MLALHICLKVAPFSPKACLQLSMTADGGIQAPGLLTQEWWRALRWLVKAQNILDKYLKSAFNCQVFQLHLHFISKESVTESNFICVYSKLF